MFIRQSAPSRRTAIYQAQAEHLADLCDWLTEAALRHQGAETARELPEDDHERFASSAEYRLFSTGVYACGFVCDDLSPDFDIESVHRDPRQGFATMDLKRLRRYVHTLMRIDRANAGCGSAIYEALRAGALAALAGRIRQGGDLYADQS